MRRKALELYTAALGGSRTMQDAFLQEAHTALGVGAGRARRAPARAASAEREPPQRARAFPLRPMWCRQRHLALALSELPHLGFPAERE